MSSDFSHRICERCWFDVTLIRDTHPIGQDDQGLLLMPNQDPNLPEAPCCVCGGMCITRTRFRRHPDDLACRGRHDDYAAWAGVNPTPA